MPCRRCGSPPSTIGDKRRGDERAPVILISDADKEQEDALMIRAVEEVETPPQWRRW